MEKPPCENRTAFFVAAMASNDWQDFQKSLPCQYAQINPTNPGYHFRQALPQSAKSSNFVIFEQ